MHANPPVMWMKPQLAGSSFMQKWDKSRITRTQTERAGEKKKKKHKKEQESEDMKRNIL